LLKQLHARLQGSNKFETVLQMIQQFERSSLLVKYKSSWNTFLSESRWDDFVSIDTETIFVSTIHKSKGKEFDNVYVMLQDFVPRNDEETRALYVAFTRSKINLHIHYNHDYLRALYAESLTYINNEIIYPEPQQLTLMLSHKSVRLGYFEFVQHRIQRLQSGETLTIMEGGLGNAKFATATNQAPEYAQPGEEGVEGWKVLELKVLADVGLVGFPNAGKSTLLSVVTAAKPKVADYAFTTLVPNLGMVEYRDGKSFCIADLPGIIEGAAEGKGLGHRFLRHIERNSVLLFLIPADASDHRKEFDILVNELEQYNPELLHKQFLIAVSKSDMLDDELKEAIAKELPQNTPHIFISAVTGKGLTELKDVLWRSLNDM
ncbi:MAG: hypothetical protein EOO04_37125, partial [Chitinophagaceae bacterium]